MITVSIKSPSGQRRTAALMTAMDEALDVIGKYAMERISFHAGTKLHSTHLDYQHGLQNSRSYAKQPGMVTITLVGALPNMLEKGFSAFDIKVGLLKSPKVKHGKGGSSYIDVPFRWGTPGSTTMQPMSKQTHGAVMSLVRAARKQGAAASLQRIQTQARTSGAVKMLGRTKVTAKAGVQDQMTRTMGAYASTTQAQHHTFRRISLNSAQKSWIHPGFNGVKAFRKAEEDIRRDVPRILHDFLKNAGVSK